MQLTIGADPEVFAKNNGEFVSAHGMVPGTKDAPYPVKNGAVQVDGMALEFNIDPASTEEEFVFNIDSVMSQLRDMAGAELAAVPVAHFEKEYMEMQPPEARELGCDPDYNAWTGGRNDQPDAAALFRTGAGHVHLGWLDGGVPENHEEMCTQIVKQLDYYLGLPSLVFDPDVQRRALYGQAGAYRAKPYGVEYRVLSNKWLASKDLQRWVYRNTVAAFESMRHGVLAVKHGDIQHVINNSLVGEAVALCKELNIEIPEVAHVG